ncbi:amidohydrolase family protein, partial [Mycobacterium kansasii]
GHAVDSPDEMRKAVRTAFKHGVETIKVMATGGVMTPNDFMEDPQLSVAEMRVAVEEAHHKRRLVAAHAEGNPGIQNALDAGVDSIEHG